MLAEVGEPNHSVEGIPDNQKCPPLPNDFE